MRRNFLFISFITVLLFILIVSCTPPQNATVEYTITFDGNGSDGGSTITEKALDGATYTITPSVSFNRKGYTLKSWNTERDGKGTTYSTSDKIKISKNITLYAQWEIITYTITYNLDDGRLEDGVTNPTSYTIESETFTLNNPVKDGNTFSGWRVDGNEDKITTPLKIAKGTTGNRTYIACWEAISEPEPEPEPEEKEKETYTITYSINIPDKSESREEETEEGTAYKVSSSIVFNRDGYTFRCWNTSIDGTGKEYNADDTIEIKSNLTLYAKWTPITYKIEYNLDGGKFEDGSSNPVEYTIETKTFTLNPPIKDGYTFIGWSENGVEEKSVEVKIVKGTTGNRTYTAIWAKDALIFTLKDVNTYSVRGNNQSLDTITIPSTYNNLPVTEIEEYGFSNYSNLKTIYIPSTVTRIGSYAFECTKADVYITIGKDWEQENVNNFGGCRFNVSFDEDMTEIPSDLFSYSYQLVSVEIPKNIKKIGYGAFLNCSELKIVTIEEGGNCNIEDNAFKDCHNLTTLSLPDDISAIGMCCFSGCSSLTSITFPSTLKTIEYSAFSGCSSLTSITIPSTIVKIEDCAFENCSSLKEIIIPSSVTEIGYSAFYGCNAVIKLTIGDGWRKDYYYSMSQFEECKLEISFDENLKKIPDRAFEGLSNEITLTIPSTIEEIGEEAFYECKGLKEIEIPDSVTVIGENAFYRCTGLESKRITITSNVTSIGYGAFYECNAVIDLEIGKDWKSPYWNYHGDYNETYFSVGAPSPFYTCTLNISFDEKLDRIPDYAFIGIQEVKSITIPDTIKEIGCSAFRGCINLKEINIPKSVDTIGTGAFHNCSGLENITIPEGVKTIKSYAFYYCTNLKGIEIPDGVTTIGAKAFYSTGTNEFDIPSSVEFIGSEAFGSYGTLNIVIGDKWQIDNFKRLEYHTLNISFDDKLTKIPDYFFRDYSSSSYISIKIGNNIKEIGTYAFVRDYSYRVWIHDLEIPSSVTKIGDYAFYMTNIQSLTINNSSNCTIGEGAFSESALESVSITSGNITIGKYAFYRCDYISKINLKATYKCDIGSNAFYSPSYTKLESVSIDAKNIIIGESAFSGCNILNDIKLINSTSCTIGDYAFSYTGLSGDITIPDSVTSIGKYAFSGCNNIDSITIPKNVTAIGEAAFYGCYADIHLTIGNGWKGAQKDSFSGCKLTVDFAPDVVMIPDYCLYNIDISDFYTSNSITLNIPNTVKEIGNYAFLNCTGLTDINIPSSVYYIGGCAFNSGSTLNIEIGEDWEPDNVQRLEQYRLNVSFDKSITKIPDSALNSFTKELNVTIEDNISEIGNSAFSGCTGLYSISLPNNITNIGDSAFSGCTYLNNFTLPDNLTNIGDSAFSGCTYLNYITLPDNLTNIGDSAFSGCTMLSSITIPASVTCIGNYAFSGCTSLYSIEIKEGGNCTIGYNAFSGTNLYSIEINNVSKIYAGAFSNCTNLRDVTIYVDDSLYIKEGVFSGCTYLYSINVKNGNSCTIMGGFSGCNNLRRITISSRDVTIKSSAFSGCSTLSEFTLENNGSCSIEDYAFNKCTGLTSISIPKTVTKIGKDAFYGCTGLSSITIPYLSGDIKEKAFSDCTSLKKVTIETINKGHDCSIEQNAFYNCTKLESITIPSGITSIGSSAFEECNKLKGISIPVSVTYIGSFAFPIIRGLDIYYAGTEAQWNMNNFGTYNNYSIYDIHYESTGPDTQSETY